MAALGGANTGCGRAATVSTAGGPEEEWGAIFDSPYLRGIVLDSPSCMCLEATQPAILGSHPQLGPVRRPSGLPNKGAILSYVLLGGRLTK